MGSEYLTRKTTDDNKEEAAASWLQWCRLCAKRELSDQETSSIFDRKHKGKHGSELATSVGKYFWVNIKSDDEISQCLCCECQQLVEELVTFTERVNKVQTLYVLLQNIKPSTAEQANKFRQQCGLFDEGWQHIIKPEAPKIPDLLPKPLLIDQQVQTEVEEIQETEDDQSCSKDISRNEHKEVECESQNETEAENEQEQPQQQGHVYEYVMQNEQDMEFCENDEYIVPGNNLQRAEEITEDDEEEEEEVQDSDLFKELKFKLEDEDDEVPKEQNQTKRFKIISPNEGEVEVEYQDNSQTMEQQQEEYMQESMEVLEEDEEEYVNTSETKLNAFELLNGCKRGRPVGSKNSDDISYRFECKECKRRYKNPNIFRKHMLTVHKITVELPDFPPPSNVCSICDKVFVSHSSLKFHMKHHLPDEEKFNIPCPYCERKFTQVGAMRQHVNGIHHQMKPFICDQCGRACKTMAALNEHQLVHTNECPFECEVCHKRFKNKPRLKAHMDIHTKSLYKCPDCNMELNTKRTLLQHRLVHSDEKRFKCEFCDAAFKRSKALKNHLILHSGLRPYKCKFCNKSFSNGSNCRAHKKRAHPKELAEEEANGKVSERVPIPKLEELKSAKGILLQPRKVKRSSGLSDNMRKLLQNSEKRKQQQQQQKQQQQEEFEDPDTPADNYETYSEMQYDADKYDADETESLVDNHGEDCEETVIYEIIDEI
ncbi:zinc finger protein weckle-like isoform 2-T2 [Cochliomyia hominivorax]